MRKVLYFLTQRGQWVKFFGALCTYTTRRVVLIQNSQKTKWTVEEAPETVSHLITFDKNEIKTHI